MVLAKTVMGPNSMIDQKSLLLKCRIRGLKLTPKYIRKVKKTIEYSYIQLDSLLIFHQEKVKSKLIDDLYFLPTTLAVLEYKGKTYTVERM